MSTRALPLVALLAGCAAMSGEGHLLTEDARLAANVRSCCNSPAEALTHKQAAVPAQQPALLWFASTTPHFDFGDGMAPFAVFALGDRAGNGHVELESLMRLRGWAHGGDGKAHYADARALFFDSSGKPIPAPAIERVERATRAGVGALFQTFPIPSGAAHLVVTSNPKSNGKSDSAGVLSPPTHPAVAASSTLILPGSVFPLGSRLATYGPVQVRWGP